MKTLPLRWQITLWAALSTALALVAFGTVVVFEVYDQQVETIDAQLATDAGLVLAPEPSGPERMAADLARLTNLPRGEFSLAGFAMAPTGRSAVVRAQPEYLAALMPATPRPRQFFSRRVGRHWMRIGVFSRQGTTLLLATSLHRVIDSIEDLLGAYGIAFPIVLLFVAGGSWWIARRALRPVAAITTAAASITADRLHERLPVPGAADEISRHIQVLNGMLDRLQHSFEQANRFTADAAHELRTPLTIMRGQIEDALRSGVIGAEHERLLLDLLDETTGLQKIADNLLLLARLDLGRDAPQLVPLDFGALVREAVEDAELLGAPREIAIVAEIDPALRVNGDPVMLRRVLLNLLDNAVKFNRSQGRLSIRARAISHEVELAVGNTGPGIPPDRRDALFERFYRSSADRSRDTGGSGLGLSLCREIVTAHGGRIALNQSSADWTEFKVCLPRIADTEPAR